MNSKEELNSLLKEIKRITRLTQGEISKRAGYTETYLSEIKSRTDIPSKLIRALKATFKTELETGKPIPGENYSGGGRSKTIDLDKQLVHDIILLKAMSRVMLRNQAEILAAQQKRTVTSVLSEMNRAVKDETSEEFDSL